MSHVVVIGGGLSGLSAAHRVREREPENEVTVLEASDRTGGILGTVERDGFVIETGPDSILSEKTSAVELAERLGIADRIVETRNEHRGAYVVHRGRLVRVPAGFSLMAPARWTPWAKTPLISPAGKLRAALEVALPRKSGDDESMASFVRRRFGQELLDRLAQPLVGGIYGGDPDRLSLEATMPRFVEMEREHGSVIRAMRAKRRRSTEQAASGARYGLFVAFDRGMQVLIDALTEAVGDVRLNTPVEALEVVDDGFRVATSAGALHADRVIVALPAWRAAKLLAGPVPSVIEGLESIPYGSAATVTFAWPRAEVPHAMDAFGFVVPAVERRSILAATFSSVKWPGRAPDGEVLLRVFIGGENALDAADLDDETLIATSRRELSRLMNIEAAPRFSIVKRYRRAMPQYQVGHTRRVDAIEHQLARVPGLELAGNAYRGVGIPDSIRAAEAAADRLVDKAS
ncbi:MAG: protoporphyrinogen oxidase [Sandaracinaceae bacterium]